MLSLTKENIIALIERDLAVAGDDKIQEFGVPTAENKEVGK